MQSEIYKEKIRKFKKRLCKLARSKLAKIKREEFLKRGNIIFYRRKSYF